MRECTGGFPSGVPAQIWLPSGEPDLPNLLPITSNCRPPNFTGEPLADLPNLLPITSHCRPPNLQMLGARSPKLGSRSADSRKGNRLVGLRDGKIFVSCPKKVCSPFSNLIPNRTWIICQLHDAITIIYIEKGCKICNCPEQGLCHVCPCY